MKIAPAFICLVILVACNNASEHEGHQHENNASVAVTASDSLYKAVMHVHDVEMLRMGEIARYKKLLEAKIDSLQSLKVKNASGIDSLQTAVKDLSYADELMNKWMVEFDPNAAGTTEDQKLSFYLKEKEKIDTVSVRITNSVQRAKQLTGQ